MELHNDVVPLRQKILGLAGSLGPCPASFGHVRLDFRDTTIGTGCRKALGLDAHNLRVKYVGMPCMSLRLIAAKNCSSTSISLFVDLLLRLCKVRGQIHHRPEGSSNELPISR